MACVSWFGPNVPGPRCVFCIECRRFGRFCWRRMMPTSVGRELVSTVCFRSTHVSLVDSTCERREEQELNPLASFLPPPRPPCSPCSFLPCRPARLFRSQVGGGRCRMGKGPGGLRVCCVSTLHQNGILRASTDHPERFKRCIALRRRIPPLPNLPVENPQSAPEETMLVPWSNFCISMSKNVTTSSS